MSSVAIRRRAPRLPYFHCTFAGAAALGMLFLLLWAGSAFADIDGSKTLLALFSQQALRSPAAVAEGAIWAVIIGGMFGALVAVSFNFISFMTRR
jgi:hypothetical protein